LSVGREAPGTTGRTGVSRGAARRGDACAHSRAWHAISGYVGPMKARSRAYDLCSMITRTFVLVMVGVLTIAITSVAQAQLRGHGGPVRALAVSPDGTLAVSGSFDTSVIRWSLERNAAVEVLRFHEGAVNAVAYLSDGRIATAGEDG